MSWLRENWRVSLLVLLLLGSAVAMFAPGIGASSSTDAASADRPTNLNYGLELSGGVRLRATATGVTADGIDVTQSNQQTIESDLEAELGLEDRTVQARPQLNTVEVFSNVSTAETEQTLTDLGYQPDSVRVGVTEETRETIVSTIQSKVDATGFSGASVYQIETQTGDRTHYIVAEVPGQNASQVQSLIQGRGEVELWAHYPQNGNQTNTTVLQREDMAEISPPRIVDGQPAVPIVLTDEAAGEFAGDMREYGFTSNDGIRNCQYPQQNTSSYCLLSVLDDEVVYDANMGPTLANSIETGEFERSPNFVITASSMEEARELQVNLRAGSLPTSLEFQNSYYVAPSFADRYKPLSLVTGLAAAVAMAGVVFLRYGKPEVAIPMVFTALSEVAILLGFASATGLALDLSHIAGFIAVIGTGVDDLVIIADEVMTEQVSSSRVFQSRFRKALWVIGAAAVTTIIAMSPLAVLSLGDLRGFALITILGVLIGVLITRPAYGDILRRLLTDNR
jgi:preprotein translocase subunit SecD